jgi:hypothetical protein
LALTLAQVNHIYVSPLGNDWFCTGSKYENSLFSTTQIEYDIVDFTPNSQEDRFFQNVYANDDRNNDPTVSWFVNINKSIHFPEEYYLQNLSKANEQSQWNFANGSSFVVSGTSTTVKVNDIYKLGHNDSVFSSGERLRLGTMFRIFNYGQDVPNTPEATATQTLEVADIDYVNHTITFRVAFNDVGSSPENWVYTNNQLLVICNKSVRNDNISRNVTGPLATPQAAVRNTWDIPFGFDGYSSGFATGGDDTFALIHLKAGKYNYPMQFPDTGSYRFDGQYFVGFDGEAVFPLNGTDLSYVRNNASDERFPRLLFFNITFDGDLDKDNEIAFNNSVSYERFSVGPHSLNPSPRTTPINGSQTIATSANYYGEDISIINENDYQYAEYDGTKFIEYNNYPWQGRQTWCVVFRTDTNASAGGDGIVSNIEGNTGIELGVKNSSGNKFYVKVGNGSSVDELVLATVLNNNTWYKLVVVIDGGRVRTYVNGIVDNALFVGKIVTSTSSGIKIGTNVATNNLNGDLRNIEIYADIPQLPHTWVPMDFDSLGIPRRNVLYTFRNGVVLNNLNTFAVTEVFLPSESSADTFGNDIQIVSNVMSDQQGDSSFYDKRTYISFCGKVFTGSFSYALELKIPEVSHKRRTVFSTYLYGHGFALYVKPNSKRIQAAVYSSGESFAESTVDFELNEFFDVFFDYDGTNINLYIDIKDGNGLVHMAGGAHSISHSNGNLYLGGNPNEDELMFHGEYRNLYFFDSATVPLSATITAPTSAWVKNNITSLGYDRDNYPSIFRLENGQLPVVLSRNDFESNFNRIDVEIKSEDFSPEYIDQQNFYEPHGLNVLPDMLLPLWPDLTQPVSGVSVEALPVSAFTVDNSGPIYEGNVENLFKIDDTSHFTFDNEGEIIIDLGVGNEKAINDVAIIFTDSRIHYGGGVYSHPPLQLSVFGSDDGIGFTSLATQISWYATNYPTLTNQNWLMYKDWYFPNTTRYRFYKIKPKNQFNDQYVRMRNIHLYEQGTWFRVAESDVASSDSLASKGYKSFQNTTNSWNQVYQVGLPMWISMSPPTPTLVRQYLMYTNASYYGKAWIFQASTTVTSESSWNDYNDNANWIDLDTVTNNVESASFKSIPISASPEFTSYRLYFTASSIPTDRRLFPYTIRFYDDAVEDKPLSVSYTQFHGYRYEQYAMYKSFLLAPVKPLFTCAFEMAFAQFGVVYNPFYILSNESGKWLRFDLRIYTNRIIFYIHDGKNNIALWNTTFYERFNINTFYKFVFYVDSTGRAHFFVHNYGRFTDTGNNTFNLNFTGVNWNVTNVEDYTRSRASDENGFQISLAGQDEQFYIKNIEVYEDEVHLDWSNASATDWIPGDPETSFGITQDKILFFAPDGFSAINALTSPISSYYFDDYNDRPVVQNFTGSPFLSTTSDKKRFISRELKEENATGLLLFGDRQVTEYYINGVSSRFVGSSDYTSGSDDADVEYMRTCLPDITTQGKNWTICLEYYLHHPSRLNHTTMTIEFRRDDEFSDNLTFYISGNHIWIRHNYTFSYRNAGSWTYSVNEDHNQNITSGEWVKFIFTVNEGDFRTMLNDYTSTTRTISPFRDGIFTKQRADNSMRLIFGKSDSPSYFLDGYMRNIEIYGQGTSVVSAQTWEPGNPESLGISEDNVLFFSRNGGAYGNFDPLEPITPRYISQSNITWNPPIMASKANIPSLSSPDVFYNTTVIGPSFDNCKKLDIQNHIDKIFGSIETSVSTNDFAIAHVDRVFHKCRFLRLNDIVNYITNYGKSGRDVDNLTAVSLTRQVVNCTFEEVPRIIIRRDDTITQFKNCLFINLGYDEDINVLDAFNNSTYQVDKKNYIIEDEHARFFKKGDNVIVKSLKDSKFDFDVVPRTHIIEEFYQNALVARVEDISNYKPWDFLTNDNSWTIDFWARLGDNFDKDDSLYDKGHLVLAAEHSTAIIPYWSIFHDVNDESVTFAVNNISATSIFYWNMPLLKIKVDNYADSLNWNHYAFVYNEKTNEFLAFKNGILQDSIIYDSFPSYIYNPERVWFNIMFQGGSTWLDAERSYNAKVSNMRLSLIARWDKNFETPDNNVLDVNTRYLIRGGGNYYSTEDFGFFPIEDEVIIANDSITRYSEAVENANIEINVGTNKNYTPTVYTKNNGNRQHSIFYRSDFYQLNNESNFTFEFWFNPTQEDIDNSVTNDVYLVDSPDRHFSFFIKDKQLEFFSDMHGISEQVGGMIANKWYHVAVMLHDEWRLWFYYNGVRTYNSPINYFNRTNITDTFNSVNSLTLFSHRNVDRGVIQNNFKGRISYVNFVRDSKFLQSMVQSSFTKYRKDNMDYVESYSPNLRSDTFTWAFKVIPRSLHLGTILSTYEGSTSSGAYVYFHSNGWLYLIINNTSVAGIYSNKLGEEISVVVTYNGSQGRLWIDGVRQSTFLTTGTPVHHDRFTIGRVFFNATVEYYGDYDLKEIEVYSSPILQTEDLSGQHVFGDSTSLGFANDDALELRSLNGSGYDDIVIGNTFSSPTRGSDFFELDDVVSGGPLFTEAGDSDYLLTMNRLHSNSLEDSGNFFVEEIGVDVFGNKLDDNLEVVIGDYDVDITETDTPSITSFDDSTIELPAGLTSKIISQSDFEENFKFDGEYISLTNNFLDTAFGYKPSTGRKTNVGADLPVRAISETADLSANNGIFTFDDSASSIFVLNSAGHPYLKFEDSEWRFKDELELMMTNFTASAITVTDNTDVNIGDVLMIPAQTPIDGVEGEYVLVTNKTGNTTINIQRFSDGVSGLDVNVAKLIALSGTSELIYGITSNENDAIFEIAKDDVGTHSFYNFESQIIEEPVNAIINHSYSEYDTDSYIQEADVSSSYTTYSSDYYEETGHQNYTQYNGSSNSSTINWSIHQKDGIGFDNGVYAITANFSAAKVFDGNTGSVQDKGWIQRLPNGTGWLTFVFDTPTVINKYQWRSLYPFYYAGNPTEWYIDGSFDGVKWKRLDHVSGVGYVGNNVWRTYTFTNGNPYRHYRFMKLDGYSQGGMQNLNYIAEPTAPEGTPAGMDRYDLVDVLGDNPYVMCVEFRVTSNATRGVIGHYDGVKGAGIEITPTGATFYGADMNATISGVTMPLDKWCKVILRWDGTTFRGLLNVEGQQWQGTDEITPTTSSDMIPVSPFNIGRRGGGGTAFTGDLRNVEYYKGIETDFILRTWTPGNGFFRTTLDVQEDFTRSFDTELLFQSRLGSDINEHRIEFTKSGTPTTTSPVMVEDPGFTEYDGVDDAYIDDGAIANQLTNTGAGQSFTWAVEVLRDGILDNENAIFIIPDTSSGATVDSIMLTIEEDKVTFNVGDRSVTRSLETFKYRVGIGNDWIKIVAHYNHKQKAAYLSVNENIINDIDVKGGITYPSALDSELRIGKAFDAGSFSETSLTPSWNENEALGTYTVNGDQITKSGTGWNTGIFTNESTTATPGNYIEFQNNASGNGMVGFAKDLDDVSDINSSTGYTSGQYMWYPFGASVPQIYESGSYRGQFGSTNNSSRVYRLEFYDAGSGNVGLRYYQDAILRYTSSVLADTNASYKGFASLYSSGYSAYNFTMIGTPVDVSVKPFNGKMRNIEMFVGEINNREVLQHWVPGSGKMGDSSLIYQSKEGKGA